MRSLCVKSFQDICTILALRSKVRGCGLVIEVMLLNCFQICIEGECSPFYPEGQPDIDDNSIDNSNRGKKDGDVQNSNTFNEPLDIVDGRPAWYDPIFTEVFIELRKRFVS